MGGGGIENKEGRERKGRREGEHFANEDKRVSTITTTSTTTTTLCSIGFLLNSSHKMGSYKILATNSGHKMAFYKL